jgi:prepilin-type N-terminal cleavage/methylation domain-containing protein
MGLKISKKGFTLIEVVLSLSVLLILSAASLPIIWPYLTQNDLEVATQVTTESLRRAQVLAMAQKKDSSWGVKIQANNVIIFQGTSFENRDNSFDELINFLITLQVSGPDEIIFEKLSGIPNQNGNIVLSNSENQSKSVNINSKGLITY